MVECNTSIAINYCYFARLQQRAVNLQLLEGPMKPSRVEHNVFTVRHQFAQGLKALMINVDHSVYPKCPSRRHCKPDGLVYKENGTRLYRLNETSQFNFSWYF